MSSFRCVWHKENCLGFNFTKIRTTWKRKAMKPTFLEQIKQLFMFEINEPYNYFNYRLILRILFHQILGVCGTKKNWSGREKKKLQLMLFCCWPLVGYFGAIIFLSGNTNPSKIVTMTCSSFSSTDNDLRYTNSKPYLFWFTKNDYLEHIFINSWILKTNLGSSQYFFFIQIRMIRRKRSTFSFCPITMP